METTQKPQMNNGILIIQENHCYDPNNSVLIQSPQLLSQIAEYCIKNRNEILFARNHSGAQIKFGIKLEPDNHIPCNALLKMNLLKNPEIKIWQYDSDSTSVYERENRNSLLRSLSNLIFVVLDISGDAQDSAKVIELYTRMSDKTVFSNLWFGKNKLEWTLGSMDYYDLKSVSQKIRESFTNVKEYLFQKGDGAEIPYRLERMENAVTKDDESHLIIYK